MAVVSGTTGALQWTINGVTTHGTLCFRWAVTTEGAQLETTAFGDTYRKFITGITGWSGSATFRCDSSIDPPLPGSSTGAITSMTLTESNGQSHGSLTANVESVSTDVEFDGQPTFTVNFRGTSAWA